MATLRVLNKPPREGLCKGCMAAVLWATTVNGAPMILDKWEPRFDEDDGCALIDSADTHWATCPQRQQFERRRPT